MLWSRIRQSRRSADGVCANSCGIILIEGKDERGRKCGEWRRERFKRIGMDKKGKERREKRRNENETID